MLADTRTRIADAADAAALAELCGQLGYPCVPESVPARLARLARDPNARAIVATCRDEVVGLATVHVRFTLNHDAPIAQLSLLVVHDRVRRGGVGRLLVDAVARFAAERGAERLVVTTALQRADAHRFYEMLGFTHTGRRYAKPLGTATSH